MVQFPFFCKDREYIIGRRIWECGRSYYCVTKVFAECSLFLLEYLKNLIEDGYILVLFLPFFCVVFFFSFF